MKKVYTKVTDCVNFFEGHDPVELAQTYQTPLYVYNERILRQRCRDLKQMVTYPKFVVDYSAKANCNLAFLQVVRSEGLEVDAMSPGEIYVERQAGFKPDQIFYIGNNVSEAEMQYAIDAGVLVSVDSLAQLEQFGRLAPGHEVAVRFNPGVGAGHHENVVTAGKKTKFGIGAEYVSEVNELLKKYKLQLVGINQHIGSLFMNGEAFVSSIGALFDIARQFEGLRFVDMGGGFGIPYQKADGETALDLKELGEAIDRELYRFAKEYGSELTFRIEPGRYISAESSVILSKVHATKMNHEKKFVGCDCGFNVLQRPVMYDAWHDIEIYRPTEQESEKEEIVTIVGNICESGDKLAEERCLPEIFKGDILGILDTGAYGFSMASNYNNRLRPAEIMIRENGEVHVIRERETLEDLLRHMIPLNEA